MHTSDPARAIEPRFTRTTWFVVIATIVTAALIALAVGPLNGKVDAAPGRAKALQGAQQLASDPIVQREYPELAAFMANLASQRIAAAQAVGRNMVAHHDMRTRAHRVAAAERAAHVKRLPAFGAIGLRGQIALDFVRTIVCPILNNLVAAFAGIPVIATVLNSLLVAFGCVADTPPPTSGPSTTAGGPTSTATPSSIDVTTTIDVGSSTTVP